MAFVNEKQRIIRDIFEQRRRRLTGIAAGEITRIVFDTGAGAGRLQHFDVVARALFQPLGFQQASRLFQLGEADPQLFLDRLDSTVQRRPRVT